jgi:transposase
MAVNESFRHMSATKLRLAIRRQEVKQLVAEGMSNVAIAGILGVDEGTIRNDRKNSDLDGKTSKRKKTEAEALSEYSWLREELEKNLALVAQVRRMLDAALAALRPAADG